MHTCEMEVVVPGVDVEGLRYIVDRYDQFTLPVTKDGTGTFTDTQAKVDGLRVEDGKMLAHVEVIDTPAGKPISDLFRVGAKFKLRPVGVLEIQPGVEPVIDLDGFAFIYEPMKPNSLAGRLTS